MDGFPLNANNVLLVRWSCGHTPRTRTSIKCNFKINFYSIVFLCFTHLSSSFLVRVQMLLSVHLETMRFQRASLRKRFLAQITLVRSNAGMRASVSLQIERIVKTFSAKCAQISFNVRVTFHVPIEQSLQRKRLRTDLAGEFVRIVVGNWNRGFFAAILA